MMVLIRPAGGSAVVLSSGTCWIRALGIHPDALWWRLDDAEMPDKIVQTARKAGIVSSVPEKMTMLPTDY
jgi:hypothetical protein